MGNKVDIFLANIRPECIAFLRKKFPALEEEAIEDVYADSIEAIYNNIYKGKLSIAQGKMKVLKNGQLEDLTCKLSTYFFEICRRQGLKKCDKLGRTKSYDTFNDAKISELIDEDDGMPSEQRAIMREIVSKLPSPCEEILWSYYGDDMSMDEIATKIGSKNADTAKSQKSRCMSKLKKKLNDIKTLIYG